MPRLADSLFATTVRRAHEAEQSAAGAHRRPAFRLTRELIGAAVRAGVPRQSIATVLGISASAVSTRISNHDGGLTAGQVLGLTGVTPETLGLAGARAASTGRFPVSALVAATLDRPAAVFARDDPTGPPTSPPPLS